jgi:hypothetical protein
LAESELLELSVDPGNIFAIRISLLGVRFAHLFEPERAPSPRPILIKILLIAVRILLASLLLTHLFAVGELQKLLLGLSESQEGRSFPLLVI